MPRTATLTNYDQNASQYDQFRRPSPIIKSKLLNLFWGSDGPILSLGCGTGRMEKEISQFHIIVGLDRSSGMIAQARGRINHLVQADMNILPFYDNTFHGVYFMQSLHHIGANLDITPEMRETARKEVLKEAVRVIKTGKLAIIQRDPSQNQAVWFWRYFPQALETKLKIQPSISSIVGWLDELDLKNISTSPIDDPLAEGYYKPTSPLDPNFRKAFSEFSYLTDEQVMLGVEQLQMEIKNGDADKAIQECRDTFNQIGGTVFMISAVKAS